MAVLLVVLVPLAILFAWAARHDLKQRRRRAAAVDTESRAEALKASAQAQTSKYQIGL